MSGILWKSRDLCKPEKNQDFSLYLLNSMSGRCIISWFRVPAHGLPWMFLPDVNNDNCDITETKVDMWECNVKVRIVTS